MIAIFKTDGRHRPEIVCDHCAARSTTRLERWRFLGPPPRGTMARAFHVHKGRCEAKISDKGGQMPVSEELSIHLLDLIDIALSASDRESVRRCSIKSAAENRQAIGFDQYGRGRQQTCKDEESMKPRDAGYSAGGKTVED